MINVIELCLSKFVLYTIGQELYLDNLNEQHLNIIKNWYEEYINKILTSDEKLIKIVNNNNYIKIVIETELHFHDYEHLYGNDGIYNKFVMLGDTDYPFYHNKENNELQLVKELLPKGNSPSDYDTEEQAMVEFILDNSYELLTPNSNIKFITNKIISFSTEETHSN